MNVYQYLEAHHDRILQELIEFVRIPSVSTDPAYQEGILEASNWVANQLEAIGFDRVQVISTTHHPVVYGEWMKAEDAPTILVYGHYDVQPPDPLNEWISPPFEPEIRDGRLFGRGVSDDKGPLFIPIKVAQAFTETAGSLPDQREVSDRRRRGNWQSQPGNPDG